jgi:hypothetical protein
MVPFANEGPEDGTLHSAMSSWSKPDLDDLRTTLGTWGYGGIADAEFTEELQRLASASMESGSWQATEGIMRVLEQREEIRRLVKDWAEYNELSGDAKWEVYKRAGGVPRRPSKWELSTALVMEAMRNPMSADSVKSRCSIQTT